ncbi:MAG: hypothetical protein FWG02_05135 [Holophagaceae bacterium]|nr:hypothetical protein [Holophagaceae bacterium]
MRYLISRTDGIGDLVVTLPVQKAILGNDPLAHVYWLVKPEVAPILNNLPAISGILLRGKGTDLELQIRDISPDVVLNIGHRDRAVIPAAKKAGVPVRVARPRGLGQLMYATHRIWTKRSGSGRHECEHSLDFLKPLGWSDIHPSIPSLVLTSEEIQHGQNELQAIPTPRLGVILKGSGSGAFPSKSWWDKLMIASTKSGWNPVILSPPEDCLLSPTDLRGLMGRIVACSAIIGPSTGPTHLSAALGKPTLCLMGRRLCHGPDRWAPLGNKVEVLQYPGEEDDLGDGMDRLAVDTVLNALEKFR